MLNKAKRVINAIKQEIMLKRSKELHLSLGENCLTENILRRKNLNFFSTPYSHGRSNIDYAITLEQTNYTGLLDSENLYHAKHQNEEVVRSKIINQSSSIYHPIHSNGFEFTHHNVLASKKAKSSLQRKINRLKKYKGKKDFIFYYHYRFNQHQDVDMVFEKLFAFSRFYSINQKTCKMVVFTQKLIKHESERCLTFKKVSSQILFFELATLNAWEGNDQDIFWARKDNDLLDKMFATIKTDNIEHYDLGTYQISLTP